MSSRPILAGTTDVSTVIRIVDSTNGAPETGVTSATGGLDLWYRREGEVSIDLTESDLSALTDAHSAGGILHINDGYYRVDLPDDATDTDGNSPGVLVGGSATGMIVIGTYHPLVGYDPQDSVRLGLTALPNAAADGVGGLPISDDGGFDVDAILERLPAALVSGRMASDVVAISGSTDAADRLQETAETIATGVCDSGGSTTSIVTSSLDPAVSATDQLKGKIVTFERDTTTAALRSQSTDITASTSAGVLTVTALTDAPVSGDTFSVT